VVALAALEDPTPNEESVTPILNESAVTAPISMQDDSVSISFDEEERAAVAGEDALVFPPLVDITESMIPDPEVELAAPVLGTTTAEPEGPEVLLYRRSASNIACHWSLSEDTWEGWATRQDGQWVIRILEVAVADGPFEHDESDLMLPGTSGEVLCHDVQPDAQVRMAVGWKTAEHFHPVLIGVEISGDEPDELSIAWQPLSGLNDPLPETWLRCAKQHWNGLSMGAE
jgi:hypothetical protein